MTTEVVTREQAVNGATTLFVGTTPDELINAATDVATRFNDIVQRQRLYQVIGGRQHIIVEAWQTVGTLVGVFAVKDSGVVVLPWPELIELPEEPPDPGFEPRRAAAEYPAWEQADTLRRAWRQHRDLLGARNRGLAYGFAASWRAVKNGREVGWGEGRCTRGERNWATRDDYALASMAQTRGQSRALAAPLRFIVKLAGYPTTPAEEVEAPEPADPASGFGREVDDDAQRQAAQTVQALFPSIDGFTFVRFVCEQFGTERLPEASARLIAAIKWALGSQAMQGSEAPQERSDSVTGAPEAAPPDADQSAYHNPPEERQT